MSETPTSETPETGRAGGGSAPAFRLRPSPGFIEWLDGQGISLAFTTYQSGKLFFIGLNAERELSVFERTFNRCMGLCADGTGTLWMSTLYQIWRLENALAAGQRYEGYDRLYVPRLAWTTGDLDVHDLAPTGEGRPVFVNTLFSCLAAPSETHSFRPLWKPPFVSALAPEDRCHLNGLAMEGGQARYVTAVAATDSAEGWRERRHEGGVLIRVADGDTVLRGLSMPHSPRLHQGRLWLLDSGNGFLGEVDPDRGRFRRVAFCPGYLRGLAFSGDYAVTGLSRPREGTGAFAGLALEEHLRKRKARPHCGLQVIDLARGRTAHWLWIEGVVQELYDVVVLPGVRRPMALGLRSEAIQRVLSLEQPDE